MLTDKQTDRHTGENITFLAEVIKWSCSAGMCGIVWKKSDGQSAVSQSFNIHVHRCRLHAYATRGLPISGGGGGAIKLGTDGVMVSNAPAACVVFSCSNFCSQANYRAYSQHHSPTRAASCILASFR